ncbi:lysophospholipid acyltransferase 7-like, partial [Piliocolobus tephrosceles]|uniref:lysophospholipid acyltransferase 7-like n=1 Tax=Piliocolobus tephrosceles TaxID=591936 RepID=UPI000E6AEE90
PVACCGAPSLPARDPDRGLIPAGIRAAQRAPRRSRRRGGAPGGGDVSRAAAARGLGLLGRLLPGEQLSSCHALALAWTFSYLLFFRALSLLGLPTPTPFTNAIQLLLTLKLVSLASEVQDLHLAQRKEMTSGFNKGPPWGCCPTCPP